MGLETYIRIDLLFHHRCCGPQGVSAFPAFRLERSVTDYQSVSGSVSR